MFLTCEILENLQHPITKFILYLHTLETFLYKDLKTASREKDESKIMTLGPYALVLSYILSSTDYSNQSQKIFVYRGMRISKQLFRD
jgi:hypothetical protein